MATAHLLYGYMGAGKSTLAAKLEREIPAPRFSPDEWLTMLFDNDEANIKPDVRTVLDRIEALIEPIWCQCLQAGADVVLDMGFWSRASRDAVRRKAAECHAETKLYYVMCHDDVAWDRVRARNQDPGRSITMVRNTFEVLKSRFEALGPDEPHLVVDTSAAG
ncbi:MAG: ATP-binding protein [Mycobacterium sp.]|nr:ATP-binding protein [Mycobacterium sp.]